MSPTQAAPATESAVPKDPLIHKSYSLPIALSMLAVVGATVLAVFDEMSSRRPYKAIQGQYQETYSAYLAKVEAKRRDFYENVFLKLDDYVKLNEAAVEAAKSVKDRALAIQAQLDTATSKSRKLGEALKIKKSELSAATYAAEHQAHEYGHAKVEESPESHEDLAKIEKLNAGDIDYTWTESTVENGAIVKKDKSDKGKVADLLQMALDLEADKARFQQDLAAANKPATDAAKEREKWLAENLANLKFVMEKADDETKKAIAASGAAKYLDESVVSLKPDVIAGLKTEVDSIPHDWNIFRDGIGSALSHVSDMPLFRGDIKQIHVKDAYNWVDRCETCHLNERSPMPVTVESLRRVLGSQVGDLAAWDKSRIDSMPLALFASHPSPELLKAHDPERFGCSMCHNGNGVAITGKRLAHGENEDWLWPLHPKENIEAGCVQCHQQDLVLPMGPHVTAGKDDFRRAGCWGCHKYEGFNTELERITLLNGKLKDIDDAKKEKDLRSQNLRELHVAMADDESALARDKEPTERERAALTQEIAGLDTQAAQVRQQLRDAFVERQRVGPNLKDLRAKILPEFLTDWINSPRDAHKDAHGAAFRPETKMPTLRWTGDEETKDVAAFLWQSATDPAKLALPAFRPGDAKHGKELFETKGCIVCHSMGTGADRVGNDYAANLSNLAEKDRPEFVARWITHARERLVAYDPSRPVGERDVFGATAPEDPTSDASGLVWVNHTIMPNFRLNDAEVRDITTYLMSQKRADVKYEEPTWLSDTSRFERGKKLVLYQGCAGCHEIKGLEDEKGIGTELTQEGSKPIERLDFGHLTIAAERGVEPFKGEGGKGLLEDAAKLFEKDEDWYRPRGFFLHKIAKPDLYDESKYLPDRFNKLRMPQFKFAAQQILDVTTFVLGSVDNAKILPEAFHYRPEEPAQAIREGWWIVKKYNCQGCHQIEPTDVPALWKTPAYSDKLDKRDQYLPPTLVGVGFRVQPEFLAKFLRDPSLGGGRENSASLRTHLAERMPTFDFSEGEIAKLVRFFEAMAKQPAVYQKPALKALSGPEIKAATAVFKSANCQQCHVVAGVPITSETKAPNLSLAPERLRPEWMRRWIADPPSMIPATMMLKVFGDHPDPKDGKWKFMTPLPELKGVDDDHVDLMVRYLMQGLAGK